MIELRSDKDITPTSPLTFTNISTFRLILAFEALWFQNEPTHLKSKSDVGTDDDSPILPSKFGLCTGLYRNTLSSHIFRPRYMQFLLSQADTHKDTHTHTQGPVSYTHLTLPTKRIV